VTFLDPIEGGADGRGWPFGRAVHVGEIYTVLGGLDLVDYVEKVVLTGPDKKEAASVELGSGQLVELTTLTLHGYDEHRTLFPKSWSSP
jgi:hypothetical protein